jgi:hypothetical protein
MASFTDKTPVFNKYVPQQPVDAMLKVGMYKQQKYEEGYKKIQDSIDRVAGLEVLRGVDKEHLKTKMNELGDKLNWVAAGDFSNFQLTNSVAGYANDVSSDESVIAAVSSTNRIKQETFRRRELEKEGLTDANNDAYFSEGVNNYVNSTELLGEDGTPISYNGSYIQYTDIIGEMRTALTDAGLEGDLVEEIFVTDPQTGKPLVDKNGQYIYADVKVVEKISSNEKAVQAAINTVFSKGNVQQQLQIDGWANYRNRPVETLMEPLRESYEKSKMGIDNAKLNTSMLLSAENLSDDDIKFIENHLQTLEKQGIKNESEYNGLLSMMDSNPEGFKQMLYTHQFKQNINNLFLKKEKERTIETNPAKIQENWTKEYALKVQQEINDVNYKNETLKLAKSKDNLDWTKFHSEYYFDSSTGTYLKKPDSPAGSTVVFQGDMPGEKVNFTAKQQAKLSELDDNLNQSAEDIFVKINRLYNDRNGVNLSREKILASAKKQAKEEGISLEKFLIEYAENAEQNFEEANLDPSDDDSRTFMKFQEIKKIREDEIILNKDLLKQASQMAGVDDLVASVPDLPSIDFIGVDGYEKTITPEEIIQIHQWEDQMNPNTSSSGLRSGKLPDFTDTQKQFMKVKRYAQPEEVQAARDLFPNAPRGNEEQYYEPTRPPSREEVQAYNIAYEGYRPVLEEQKIKEKRAEAHYEKLLSAQSIMPGTQTGIINMEDGKAKENAVSTLAAYMRRSPKMRPITQTREKLDKLLSAKNLQNFTWKAIEPGLKDPIEWTGQIYLTLDGEEFIIDDISQTDLQLMTNQRFNPPLKTNIKQRIKTSEWGSTNLKHFTSHPDAWQQSYYKMSTMKNYDRKNYDIIRDAGYSYYADATIVNGNYQLVNYIKAPGSNKFKKILDAEYVKTEEALEAAFALTTLPELEKMIQKNNKK